MFLDDEYFKFLRVIDFSGDRGHRMPNYNFIKRRENAVRKHTHAHTQKEGQKFKRGFRTH